MPEVIILNSAGKNIVAQQTGSSLDETRVGSDSIVWGQLPSGGYLPLQVNAQGQLISAAGGGTLETLGPNNVGADAVLWGQDASTGAFVRLQVDSNGILQTNAGSGGSSGGTLTTINASTTPPTTAQNVFVYAQDTEFGRYWPLPVTSNGQYLLTSSGAESQSRAITAYTSWLSSTVGTLTYYYIGDMFKYNYQGGNQFTPINKTLSIVNTFTEPVTFTWALFDTTAAGPYQNSSNEGLTGITMSFGGRTLPSITCPPGSLTNIGSALWPDCDDIFSGLMFGIAWSSAVGTANSGTFALSGNMNP